MIGKPVVLRVDDTLSVLEGRQVLLEENGYKVLTATGGKEVVQLFVSTPPSALEAADAFISKSEPIISFLEKVDYLLSLRLLFQPLEILGTDNTGGQSQHKNYRLDRMASSRKARAS